MVVKRIYMKWVDVEFEELSQMERRKLYKQDQGVGGERELGGVRCMRDPNLDCTMHS